MRLSDEPVVAETLVAALASIGYIVVQGVAEDILSGRCDGNMAGLVANDDTKLTLPVDLVAPARQSNRLGRRSPRPVVT